MRQIHKRAVAITAVLNASADGQPIDAAVDANSVTARPPRGVQSIYVELIYIGP
jgi:hypothetical protein